MERDKLELEIKEYLNAPITPVHKSQNYLNQGKQDFKDRKERKHNAKNSTDVQQNFNQATL